MAPNHHARADPDPVTSACPLPPSSRQTRRDSADRIGGGKERAKGSGRAHDHVHVRNQATRSTNPHAPHSYSYAPQPTHQRRAGVLRGHAAVARTSHLESCRHCSALAALPPSLPPSDGAIGGAPLLPVTPGHQFVKMLHHSNSRNQRNRGSRIKTLLQATLLLGVVFWLLYQVKHSYAKKNEYLDDTEDQLAHNDRSMFQGRKEKAGSYNDNKVGMDGENSDVITKPEEGDANHHSDASGHSDEKGGETVFDKDSTDMHEDDKRNTERSEAEEGQVNNSDGNTEAQNNNNEDEKAGHSEEDKHDTESNSDAESKSEAHSTADDVTQHNQAQEENTDETNGTSQGEESTNADQTNASGSGSDGEGGEKKELMDTQTGSESLPGDANADTNGGHDAGSLPDETGNVPSVHTDKSQNDASENQGDAASTTSDSSEHSITEDVRIETRLEDVAASTSSETTSSHDKGNSVESDSSDRTNAEEKNGTASGDDEKSAETVTSSGANSDEGSAMTEATNAQAANTETGNSQGDSSGDAVTGSSEEAKPVSNQSDGATETSNNGEQVDTKIETITSTNDEHKESQGGDGSSGSNDSNGSHPEQTGNTESQ
ncbi:hypothetical protein EJB05_41228, partial [Eragrostis curvula]